MVDPTNLKPRLFKFFAHGVRLCRLCGNLLHRFRRVHARLAVHELPDVAVKAAELLLNAEKRLCIFRRRSDLEFVADDAGIAHQPLNLSPVVARHALRIESVESLAVFSRLFRIVFQLEPCLRPFEDEKFKERAVVMHRHAPFFIVITNRQFPTCPGTANWLGSILRHRDHRLSPSCEIYSSDFGSDLLTGDLVLSSVTRSFAQAGMPTLPSRIISFAVSFFP